MNPASAHPVAPRRRWGRWIAAGLALLVTPVVILALGVWSMLTLDRDAAVLKREVAQATGSDWHTKVQLSAGWVTLSAVRAGLHFVQHEHMDEARLALRAVRHASVGVYDRSDREAALNLPDLIKRTDQVMAGRGWTRLVGVAEGRQQVLIYASEAGLTGDQVALCLAVVDGHELVVVSTQVDGETLGELVAKHAPEGFSPKAKFAKLGF